MDLECAAIHTACPTLTLKELREYSYPALFYAEVRSALVHEYELGEQAAGWGHDPDCREISYSNEMVGHNPYIPAERKVHFPVEWLAELTRSIGERIDQAQLSKGQQQPSRWWSRAS